MAYAAWSVVYGEQPTASKWNILGTNDASFNDGTGIANNAIKTAHITDANVTMPKTINPYKFSAYASGATTYAANVYTKINLAGEAYDDNNNFASSAYTVPVTGHYQFDAQIWMTRGANTGYDTIAIYVDGVAVIEGERKQLGSGANATFKLDCQLALTAGQVVDIRAFADGVNGTVNNSSSRCWFMGHMLSTA